jgi:YegS/Rv2252/BmrU family lipid kinase
MERFIAIVNPAAGGGKAAKLAGPKLAELRAQGLSIDVIASGAPGHTAQLAREAYAQGYRHFLAVGGDGTAHEIINGIFAEGPPPRRVSLGFLPFGTGNSFLRDFSKDGAAVSVAALLQGRTRPVDLLRLTHTKGQIYYFNLVSVGFAADVAAFTNRHLKFMGHLGYLVGIFVKLAQLPRRAFPLRSDEETAWDERRCLFLSLNNSKYTGGTMLIAPQADTADGLIEFVRFGPIGRLKLLWSLPTLYNGTITKHPEGSRQAVRKIEFNIGEAVDVTIDGEVFTVEMRTLEILPSAVDVYI